MGVCRFDASPHTLSPHGEVAEVIFGRGWSRRGRRGGGVGLPPGGRLLAIFEVLEAGIVESDADECALACRDGTGAFPGFG
jgi:hypothetical protein